ncbi:MAG: hypothetical protein KatS3mg028_0504 [Bacteroidia bacterium]|nr:MAG: hypothetical protein KatS3mg028_0504 [Bacteroidia bacterium]
MIKLSFIKDSLLYTIGNALPMAASIILLPFYVNYLNPANYVALSFYIGISLLYQIFFSFSFEQYYGVVYTELKQDEEKVKVLNGSVFIYLMIYGGIITLITMLIGNPILKTIFKDPAISVSFYPYGLLSVLTAFFNALFKVSMSTYIYAGKPKVFFYSNLTNFFATVVISLSGLFLFPDTLAGPIYGRFLSALIILILNLWILKNSIKWTYNHTYINEFVQKSWSLFAYSLVLWIMGNIDRYFLKNYISVNDLASYDLILKCFIGVEFIQNGLSMAIISKVFDIWKNNEKVQFSKESNRYFNVFIWANTFFVLIFTFFLPFFIRLIVKDEKYYSAFSYIGIIAAAYIVRTLYYPYNFAYLFSKKTFFFFIINACTILIQTIAFYFFTSAYGILAVVFIVLLTRFITVLWLHIHVSKNIADLNISYLKWYVIPLLSVCMYLLAFFVFSQIIEVLNVAVIVVFLILSWYAYNNEFRDILPMLKNKMFARH